MPLTLPTGLQNLLSTGWWRYLPALDIKLSDNTAFHYSSANISVNGTQYHERIKKAGTVKQSLSASVDRVSVELWNADATISKVMVTPVDVLEGATAVYSKIYINPQNSAEVYKVEMLAGIVNQVEAEDEIATLTIVSDAYALDTIVGDIQVSRKCQWMYKSTPCGYNGSLLSCDKSFDGVDGCKIHFGETVSRERFGGFGVMLDTYTVKKLVRESSDETDTSGEDDRREKNRKEYHNPRMDMMDIY